MVKNFFSQKWPNYIYSESARRDESNGTIFSPIGEGRLFGDPATGVCAQIVVQTRVIAKNVPDETQNFLNFFFRSF